MASTLRYVYDEILPAIGIDRKWVQPLGSTGKKPAGGTSGDIDLGIDANKVKWLDGADGVDVLSRRMNEYCTPILKKMGLETAHKVNQFSVRCPIQSVDGKQDGKFA